MARIEDSTAIMWNYNISIPRFKLADLAIPIYNYWGLIENERVFPIASWKVQQLFDASTGNPKCIAIKVSNIDDPNLVDVEWISYDQNNPPPPGDPDSYFILEEKYFKPERIYSDPRNSILGMRDLFLDFKTILVVRIGKVDADSAPTVYAIMAELKYKSGPGGSGGGATSGAKIPSQP